MSDKFLGYSGTNISDGTALVYAASLGAANLDASMPVKSNATKQLVSSRLDISDVTGLQTALNSKISTPFAGELSAHSYVATQGNPNKRIRITEDTISSDNGTTMDFSTTDTIDLQATNVLVNGAALATAADVTAIQTKTQNQTAIVGTTTFTGAVVASTIRDAGSTVSLTTAPNFLTLTAPFITVHGDIDMGQNRIVDVGAPTADFDAANREYVDDQKGVTSVYTTSTLPTAVGKTGQIVYVSNESKIAFSDNASWIRVATSWTQPSMSSASAPAGYAASVSSVHGVFPAGWRVFDGDFTTFGNWWHTGDQFNGSGDFLGLTTGKTGIANNGAWAVLTLDVARSISSCTLYPNAGQSPPVSWHVIYSNDGTNYTSAFNSVGNVSGYTSVTNSFTPVVAKYWGIQIYKCNTTFCIIQELRFNP